MARIVWQGSNLTDFVTRLGKVEDVYLDTAFDIVTSTVEEASVAQIKALEDAHTPTGERRAAAGGHPGRHESGNMIDRIDTKVWKEGNTVKGEWGWVSGHEHYMDDQEHGNDQIEAADSLWKSMVAVREKFKARVKWAGRRNRGL